MDKITEESAPESAPEPAPQPIPEPAPSGSKCDEIDFDAEFAEDEALMLGVEC